MIQFKLDLTPIQQAFDFFQHFRQSHRAVQTDPTFVRLYLVERKFGQETVLQALNVHVPAVNSKLFDQPPPPTPPVNPSRIMTLQNSLVKTFAFLLSIK